MSEASEDELSRDVVFDILSNPRRRFVLFYLSDNRDDVDIQELARAVAAWENEVEPEAVTQRQRKRAYVSLYQTHIPLLEDVGVVERNEEKGTVRITHRATEFDDYLVADSPKTAGWPYYFVALGLVSSAFFLAVTLDLGWFGLVSEVGAATVILLAFVGLSAAYYYNAVYANPDYSFEELVRR